MKRSARVVKPSAKVADRDDDAVENIPRKSCRVTACNAQAPICFARASDTCVGNRWTSRWYHASMGEHYCNECFEHFYRSVRVGYSEYSQWRLVWSSRSRTAPAVKEYMCDVLLPYWMQCQKEACRKWRQVPKDVDISPKFVDSFVCGSHLQNSHKLSKKANLDPCSVPEDDRVGLSEHPSWLSNCRYTPYLQQCPAAPFLTGYYPDGVGLSPTDDSTFPRRKFSSNQQPFPINPNDPLHAYGFHPDRMTQQEVDRFPRLAKDGPFLYLGLRNLILVLWAFNPKEWLTLEAVQRVMICRGLARVHSYGLLTQILAFLSQSQVINTGLVTPPCQMVADTQEQVVVLGAGISGLATAHTLHKHGYKVIVLEADCHIGGRLGPSSEWSNGYVLTGVTNNPLALMAHQIGEPLQTVKAECRLQSSCGKTIDSSTDQRIEFHYNAILDILSDWRKGKGQDDDVSLADKFKEFHQQFIRESQQYLNDGVFSQEEEKVLQFHLCNLEFACGCSTNELSSLYWDHNETLPQFGGDHAIFPQAFGPVLDKMKDGLDIRLKHKVTGVDYSDKKILIQTEEGMELHADKVVVTLPLGVLKTKSIEFKPTLPMDKQTVIDKMGAGQVEMVVVKFAENFWSKSDAPHRMLGRVPSDDSQHGVFNIFQGISTTQADGTKSHLLVSYIVGNQVEAMLSKPDEEIVTDLMDALRRMFPAKTIPKPSRSTVSRWSHNPLARMSFTFLPVGCDGSLFDLMAQDVEGKLFFAGGATNGQFADTVSGAYISGVREAYNIMVLE